MKINAITNYSYSSNNSKIRQNKPTFGNISISPEYISKLKDYCGEKTVENVINFCNNAINLKNLIGYDDLPPERKALADEYLNVMQPDEVKDFTVKFTAKSEDKPYYHSADGHVGVDRRVFVQLYSNLPLVAYHGGYNNLELCKWEPFEVTGAGLSSSKYGDLTEEELAESRIKAESDLKNTVGFTLCGDSWFPIPSENLYEVIAERINTQLDILEKSKKEGRYITNNP